MMNKDDISRYRRYRREGETALMAYKRTRGDVCKDDDLEEFNWPTRQPGCFCVSLMHWQTAIRVRPYFYNPYSRRGLSRK